MSIKELIFNGIKFLPEIPGKWYKCEGHNNWGYVWLWHIDTSTNRMITVYKQDGPDDADTLGKDTLVKLTAEQQFTNGDGQLQKFMKITECTARPDVVGEYVAASDVIQNGGGTSPL